MPRNKHIKDELSQLLASPCNQEEKLVRLLQIGCEHFGLMLGLISKIEDGAYHVVSAYPDGLVNIGEEFDLAETICDVTRQSPTVTSFSKASGTEWSTHPAYDKFSIESYIGTSYFIDGERVGTINFSSPTALGRLFNKQDEKVVLEFSKALTSILS